MRQHDRDRFQTALFAPAAQRDALFALYAFNYEIARIRESVREPMLGEIRLQWWREVIDAAYSGAPPRRHDVVEPLIHAIRAYSLGRHHFDRLIDTRARDLDPAPPATLAALETYAEGTSAPLIVLALEALGEASPETVAAATPVGTAYAMTGLIRALPLHARMGRRMIPDEIAAESGLDPDDYARPGASIALRRAVEIIARAASRHLAAVQPLRRVLPRSALPALLPARIARNTVRRLERAGYDPFARTVAFDPLQSWRLAVAALTGRF